MIKFYRCVVMLFLFSSFSMAHGQELRITKGRVMDSIPIQDTLSESFALFLPQDFDTLRPLPALFVFDPEGRGRLATQLFRSIAEEQNYIIIASNENLKQDSLKENLPKVSRLIARSIHSLPVDSNRLYAVGMGAGAQVASAVPLAYNNIRGVLAIGDAWVNPDFISKENPFLFSAVVGDKDVMLHNMEVYVEYFKKLGFPTEINYFEGGPGEWPEMKVLWNAVAGFTLQAMTSGIAEKDTEVIERLYENEVTYAEMLRRRRQYFPAYDKLEQIQKKYNPFNFQEDIKERLKNLRRTKAFRQQRRAYRRAATWEREKQEEYLNFMEVDVVTANFDHIGWWAQELEELRSEQQKAHQARTKVAHRLEGFLDKLSESHYRQLNKSEVPIDNRIFVSVLRTVIDRVDPEAYLNIIKLAGQDGDYHTALLYLEDLLKTGFNDMEALYDIEGILDLKLSREYNEKIQQYLGESKYYRADVEVD